MTTAKATANFSVSFTSAGGAAIRVRAMQANDNDRLAKFFERIPAADRQYLREQGTAAEVVHKWTTDLDYRRVFPLVALAGERVVGEATLHRDAAPALRHVAHVRILVDPAYRNQGLGKFLLRQIVAIARGGDSQLEKIVMEVVADAGQAARHAAGSLGFAETRDYTKYVHYYGGQPHDLVLMELQTRVARLEPTEPAQSML